MDNYQKAQYNAIKACQSFLHSHPGYFSTIPAAADDRIRFDELVEELEGHIAKQGEGTDDETANKDAKAALVSADVAKIAGGLRAVGTKKNDAGLKKVGKITRTELERLDEADYFNIVDKILTAAEATDNVGPLATVGIPGTLVADTRAAFDEWRGMQGEVEHAVAEGEAGTAGVGAKIPEIMDFLEGTFDNYVLVEASVNDSVTAEWAGVREINDPNTQTRALTVTVKDPEGQPIAGAVAVIEPGGFEKTTGPQGRFYFQNLEAGSYGISVSKPGFQPIVSQPFVVEAGQMTTLDVVMQLPGGAGD